MRRFFRWLRIEVGRARFAAALDLPESYVTTSRNREREKTQLPEPAPGLSPNLLSSPVEAVMRRTIRRLDQTPPACRQLRRPRVGVRLGGTIAGCGRERQPQADGHGNVSERDCLLVK